MGWQQISNHLTYGLDEQQQTLLAKTAEELATKNITVIISNHDTEFTRRFYQSAAIYSFSVQRFISSDEASRNKATEVLAIFSSK